MRPTTRTVLLVALALSCGAPAVAQQGRTVLDGPPAHERGSGQPQRGGNARMSREEFRGPPPAFDRLDTDGDGYLSRQEIQAGRAAGGGSGPIQGTAADGDADHPLAAWYAKLPVILTHTHVVPNTGNGATDWRGAARNAVTLMDRHGVRLAIVMPPPVPQGSSRAAGDLEELRQLARTNPARFRFAGGGESLNGTIENTPSDRVTDELRRQFAARAGELVTAGAVGFGETTALHFSFFQGHPFEETPPDHPLFLELADLAARHRVPIDLHVEAVSSAWQVPRALNRRGGRNPDRVEENITALERLLAHNRDAKIIWVHLGMDTTGQRTPELTRRLLAKHPNLYLSISGFWRTNKLHPLVLPDGGPNPDWRDVILAYPDRVMIGSDTFFQPDRAARAFPDTTGPATSVVRMPSFLPPAVARKVAFENAQRVFGFQVIKPASYPLPGQVTPRPQAAPAVSLAGSVLTAEEIRAEIGDHTLRFVAPSNGRLLAIYFAPDEQVEMTIDGGNRVVRKTWHIDDQGQLCRTFGRQDKVSCVKVRRTADADRYVLVNRLGETDATRLAGRRLGE